MSFSKEKTEFFIKILKERYYKYPMNEALEIMTSDLVKYK